MPTLTIAGLQMLVTEDVQLNTGRILDGIDAAAEAGADFLLTPEGALSGYYADFRQEDVAEALHCVTSAARSRGVGLALGTCYKEPQGCYNQVRVYSPEGEYLGFHAKILRCDDVLHPGTGEINEFAEGTLRTFTWREIPFGVLICNDLWATPGWTTLPNPYLPWKLAQMGARIILHAVNSGCEPQYRAFHEASEALWAQALHVYIVNVNAAGEEYRPINARSGVIGPDGQRLVCAPEVGEQFFTYTIALS